MFETPTSGVLKSDDHNLPVFFSEGWEQLLEISSDSNADRLVLWSIYMRVRAIDPKLGTKITLETWRNTWSSITVVVYGKNGEGYSSIVLEWVNWPMVHEGLEGFEVSKSWKQSGSDGTCGRGAIQGATTEIQIHQVFIACDFFFKLDFQQKFFFDFDYPEKSVETTHMQFYHGFPLVFPWNLYEAVIFCCSQKRNHCRRWSPRIGKWWAWRMGWCWWWIFPHK